MILINLRGRVFKNSDQLLKNTSRKCKERYYSMNQDWQNTHKMLEANSKFDYKELIDKFRDLTHIWKRRHNNPSKIREE